ncbi:Oligopeptide transporter 5 [Smittium mucronatum]|uniref:Oligopeptide transporter 5 n=1 Tax=Smittium mucronatum TaxID=133383 RepID=A0A1R0H2S4_9FUNG|nr:Oligopeptide transporter 5 [Smittium mucronatum]
MGLLGLGIQKLLVDYLVKSPDMTFPNILVSVSLLRSLHEKSPEVVKKVRSVRFLLIVISVASVYHFLPGFLLGVLSFFSVFCYIFKDNKLAHQLTSGVRGLGIGSISLDWSAISSYSNYPLITPLWSSVNSFAGFVLVAWIVTPILYYSNFLNFGYFPIFSVYLYDMFGNPYNIPIVVTPEIRLNVNNYLSYSSIKLNVSIYLAYFFSFAGVTSLIVHFLLNYTPDLIIYMQNTIIESKKVVGGFGDVHNRLMRFYKPIPSWWSIVLIIIGIVTGLIGSELTNDEVPWYLYLFSISVGVALTFPIGIVYAISNLRIDVSVIIQTVVGYLLPGQPMGNLASRTIGNMVVQQAIQGAENFKIGHYMKLPPRQVFFIQTLGTLVALITSFFTVVVISKVAPDLCTSNSAEWSCSRIQSVFTASSIWGLFGPSELFSFGREYSSIWYSVILGAVAPVVTFFLSKKYPGTWVSYIHAPVIFISASKFPPFPAAPLFTAMIIAFIFNFWVYRYRQSWWANYNYLLNCGIEVGTIITSTIIVIITIYTSPPNWSGNDQLSGCTLAMSPNIVLQQPPGLN